MVTIKGGFSTKNPAEAMQKLAEAGVDIKLPFKASEELVVDNIPEGISFTDYEGEKQIITKA